MAIISAVVFVPSADVPLGSVNQSPSELRVSFIVDVAKQQGTEFMIPRDAKYRKQARVAYV